MDEDIVVRAENISKDFILAHDKSNSIKGVFTTMLNKSRESKEIQHALKDISFNIKKGEFFGIVGRNGSGKSTLLKILAGIYQPTNGSVKVEGKLVPFIELGVGFNAELTGRDNVYLNGAMLGFSVKEIDEMYDDIVSFAELEKFMDQKLKNYSSGMQVRLAFSMATRAKADVLLVDEVLAVGDADFQRKCFDYFLQLKKNKKTVILVTHDMNSVREYCDRGILIEKSILVKSGTANEIASEYTKMFIEGAHSNSSKKADSERWGDGAMSFDKVSAPTKLTDENESITINMSVTANEPIEGPIIGFVIKNASGTNLIGTNTLLEEKKLASVGKNEKIKLSWTIPNVLGDGIYTIAAAAVYKGGSSVADWWENSCITTVYRKQNTPYLIEPNIDLEVKEHAGI